MYFWDASAVVPLCVAENGSERLRKLAAKTEIVTWCLTTVEVASAIERRAREGAFEANGRVQAIENLLALRQGWTEIQAVDAVVERSLRLLVTHSLRAADAAQLAAALVAVNDRPTAHSFICNDDRLLAAAAREGFVTG